MPTSISHNVLVYAGPGTCAFSVAQTLKCLKSFLNHAYDVQEVGLEQMRSGPWHERCAMFVLPGGRDLAYLRALHEENPVIMQTLKHSLSQGSMKYLGICAGAYFGASRVEFEMGRQDYQVTGSRPLALVDATAFGTVNGQFYYDGNDISMASCASMDITWTNRNLTLPMLYNGGCFFKTSNVAANVVAAYDSSRAAVVLKPESFCLSGVHFEYDPTDLAAKLSSMESHRLLPFNSLRHEFIFFILKQLGLDVKFPEQHTNPRQIYTYNHSQISIDGFASGIHGETLPFKQSFKPDLFYQELPSFLSHMVLLYAPIVSSTQDILVNNPKLVDSLPSGSVFLADYQDAGKGRGRNSWISSPACLQFTLLLKHPAAKGAQLPLIQFLMATALAEVADSHAKPAAVKIKWPNDVYIRGSADGPLSKIAGILVNSTNALCGKHFNVLVGVGFNLLRAEGNIAHFNNFTLTPIEKEAFLAQVLVKFSELYNLLLDTGAFAFDLYYQKWLHSGQSVKVAIDLGKDPVDAVIQGIDSSGYLLATVDGATIRLEPDGNSFDMLHNLIRRK